MEATAGFRIDPLWDRMMGRVDLNFVPLHVCLAAGIALFKASRQTVCQLIAQLHHIDIQSFMEFSGSRSQMGVSYK
jgi:hypothetical protein